MAAPAAETGDAGGAAARAEDSKPKITVDTGTAAPVAGQASTWYFPDLVIETTAPDALIRSVTIQFTSAITVGQDAVRAESDAANGFELLPASKDGTAVVNNAEGATAAQWQEYLRKHTALKLADAGGAKSLRMTASYKTQDRILDFNALNGHYYETVFSSVSWSEALAASERKSYLGMQGYLVTVTSKDEHDYVYSVIGTTSWMGGTCLDAYTAPIKERYAAFYEAQGIATPDVTYKGPDSTFFYYWVAGPESGKLVSYGKLGLSQVPAPDPDGGTMYTNWAHGTPNQPDNANAGEYHMSFYAVQGGGWNDWPDSLRAYYVVEYGGMPDDEFDDSGSNADVAVKVEVSVDPQGSTMHTSADDVKVGDPLDIRDTVNGGAPQTEGPDGSKGPAEVSHTFYVKDPGSPDADGDGWRLLREDEKGPSGEPVHAGEYKVVSEADKSVAPDGTRVPYAPGTDTFEIKPAEIGPDDLASGPGEGGGPDDPAGTDDPLDVADPSAGTDGAGLALRPFAKVYDGTTALPAKAASLAGIALAGADARLAWDSAEFASADVGESVALVLANARIEGADAGDYELAGLAADGSLALTGRIVPRELVVTASATVRSGTAGVPLRDASGNLVAFSSDEDVWPGSGPWERNMLAPRDASRASDGALESILGPATLSCLREGDGLPLDAESPAAGTYGVAVSFANVNPPSSRTAAEPALAAAVPLAAYPAPAVTALGGGRYDLGNYLLTLVPGQVVVSESADDPGKDPGTDPSGPGKDPSGDAGTKQPEVIADDKVTVPYDPKGKPIGKDDIAKDVADKYGDRADFPKGIDPVVTIERDGELVDAVDPSVPGTYVVTLTYTDADGNVKVIRRTYVVEGPAETALTALAQTSDRLVGVALLVDGALAAGLIALGARTLHRRRRLG
ncbi:YDG domain-containing protein [uncultured Adlercreutzia sp.]|uniref:YDG domain-containing protein n=1 Tax=uncultured Adlercreutzia sp. TaxID=875803 RepID=UPI0026F3CD58|nr:YDG domain-containing protein [uncultured Adlercreutzia sp.]